MHVPGADVVTHHVREAARLGPGRPAIWLGLRTALAIGVPLTLAPFIPAAAATWAPLAGYAVALVDKGGAYRERAVDMASVAIGVLAAVTAGSLVAGHAVLAIIVVTLGAALCALSHAFGPSKAGIGNAVALHLTVAAFLPTGGSLTPTLLGVAGGAAWAMLLGLVVWPVRMYIPARRAIAAVLEALASHARGLASTTVETRDELLARHREIRAHLETARATLVNTRRGRRGETGRGERLLAISHACDHVAGLLIGLEELAAAHATVGEITAKEAARIGDQLATLATRVLVDETRRVTPAVADKPVGTLAAPTQATAIADTDQARLLLSRLDGELARITALVDSLADDSEPSLDVLGSEPTGDDADAPHPLERGRTGARSGAAWRWGWIERVRAELDLDSAVLRHAARAAICVATAATVAAVMHLERGYWITLTTFILLQPHRAATTVRAIQRGVGTVLGAVIAAGVAWAVNDPRIVVVFVILLAGIGASVAQLNYGLFSVFVTPTFILLAELHTQDFGLVWVRVTYTLLAGAIAFVASVALWPAREQLLFSEELARALRAAGRYADAVSAAAAKGVPPGDPAIIATRRAFGVAINNAELALDRVVADRLPAEVVEPGMAMVSATRRLGAALGVLSSTRGLIGEPARANLSSLADSLQRRLAELAAAIESRKLPPAPPRPTPITDAVLGARWARVELYLAALAQASARAALQTARPRAQGTGLIPVGERSTRS